MTTNTQSVFANGVEEAALIVVFAVTGFVALAKTPILLTRLPSDISPGEFGMTINLRIVPFGKTIAPLANCVRFPMGI